MIHAEKLNAILYILLDNQRKILAKSPIDKKLTFEFICNRVIEINELWELEFLKNILIKDGYVEQFESLKELPIITHTGIKFIQDGGYNEIIKNKELDKKIKHETLKNFSLSKYAVGISLLSIIITVFLNFYNLDSIKEDLRINQENILIIKRKNQEQKKTIDSLKITLLKRK